MALTGFVFVVAAAVVAVSVATGAPPASEGDADAGDVTLRDMNEMVPPIDVRQHMADGVSSKLLVDGGVALPPFQRRPGGRVLRDEGDLHIEVEPHGGKSPASTCSARVEFSSYLYPHTRQLRDVVILAQNGSDIAVTIHEQIFQHYVVTNAHFFHGHPPSYLQFGIVLVCETAAAPHVPYHPVSIYFERSFVRVRDAFALHGEVMVLIVWFVAVVSCNVVLFCVLFRSVEKRKQRYSLMGPSRETPIVITHSEMDPLVSDGDDGTNMNIY